MAPEEDVQKVADVDGRSTLHVRDMVIEGTHKLGPDKSRSRSTRRSKGPDAGKTLRASTNWTTRHSRSVSGRPGKTAPPSSPRRRETAPPADLPSAKSPDNARALHDRLLMAGTQSPSASEGRLVTLAGASGLCPSPGVSQDELTQVFLVQNLR